MNAYLKIGISFVAGLAIGAFATKKYIEHKQNQEGIYEEENDVEEVNDEIEESEENKEEKEEIIIDRPERIDYGKIKSVNDDAYVKILDDLRYQSEMEALESLGDLANDIYDEPVDKTKPYYITQDEFEDIESYESDEYTYYADGYITDSYGMPITHEDMENSIGLDVEYYFDKYKADQIWIRNERLKMDFSVIRDLDKFVDVAPPRIRRMAGL